MPFTRFLVELLLSCCISPSVAAMVSHETCVRTKVAIMGAGFAGIGAGESLSTNGQHDFVIIERNTHIGGRVVHADFGSKSDGSPHTIELGASWVHGRRSQEGDNPIWDLVKRYNISHKQSNESSLNTYDKDGPADYFESLEELLMQAQENATALAEEIEEKDFQDTSLRTGLRYGGWDPHSDPQKQAVEFFDVSLSNAAYPERSSLLANLGDTIDDLPDSKQFDGDNVFVQDSRGYNYIAVRESESFLKPNDPRLILNTTVTSVSYSDRFVTIRTNTGKCIEAEYAICTFSVGVLQHGDVTFDPPFPTAKQVAIDAMDMGIYTKVFFQFEKNFWDDETEFFLWASPVDKGSLIWQSLNAPGFSPGSNIIFATVVGDTSARIETQSDEDTKEELMGVLRRMFPDKDIPEPVAFIYPRWGVTPWTYGSYSSIPVGYSKEMLENLRENVGRLWFAGEAVSQYQATVHGAWLNGLEVGSAIAKRL